MIELILNLLLVPLLPEWGDQSVQVNNGLQQIQFKLADLERQRKESVDQTDQVVAAMDSPRRVESSESILGAQPVLAGRLLTGLAPDTLGQQARTLNEGVGQLALRGVLHTGQTRLAIVSSGDKEHVLTVGSYLLEAYRVSQIGRAEVQLVGVQPKVADVRLTLNHHGIQP